MTDYCSGPDRAIGLLYVCAYLEKTFPKRSRAW